MPDDYRSTGYIPSATSIYWIDILDEENLARLGSGKTLIPYCYYGHASMLGSAILGLLGYRCYSLDFGMMDWNAAQVESADQWEGIADCPVERCG